MSVATRSVDDRVWTSAELRDAIGEHEDWRRFEIVDGLLVVSPPPAPGHDAAAFELAVALRPFLPAGFRAMCSVGIDLGRSYRITDATVVRRAYVTRGGLAKPADVLLAIEVESPTSVTTDRVTKPWEYAHAGIPHYWRLELDPPRLVTYWLSVDTYERCGSWTEGEIAEITEPVGVTLDLSTLLAR